MTVGPPKQLTHFPAKTDLTHQEFWRGLPTLQAEAVQLAPGRLEYKILQVTGRDLLIFRSKVAPKMASTIVPHPDWMVLMVPVDWLGDHVFNGELARPFDVFLSGGPNGYSTRGEKRHNLALGVRKSKLRDVCANLSGRDIDDMALYDQRIALGSALGTRFHRRILETIAASLEKPLGPGKFALDAAVENDLFSEIAGLIMAKVIDENAFSRLDLDPVRVVRRAEGLFEDRTTNPPSIADLCKAANVGATTLHLCFNEVYGVSPIAYLQAKRITQARCTFLAAERVPPSVKDVALSLGFTQSGRFAKRYRYFFGEYPSETLNKR
ncbi:AraC family transcriptional regulator [Actibacterium sp. XHP0104]|uniref:AraC family transcriptional regulator n=1 Tax=Actibacterium sp. XHP0104 TaxID=2984335 RepID=UPI0021E82016|nr:helix-turn-helix domain-containing protein [Actibacterium sp. XHP0104]MCV2882461.1 helix-turn-helix domain-containing protein [Actibacterium sp. XHP0104]